MAIVHITFRKTYDVGGQALAISSPRVAQTINSTATSQASTITSQYLDVATITAIGGAVFVMAGISPTAASGTGDLVPDGTTLCLAGLEPGEQIAVIDA
jgi:hypothetical protein